jgi:hypothetical protein
MLIVPFGASAIQTLLFYIIDAKDFKEFDNGTREVLNGAIDLRTSVYLSFVTVSDAEVKKKLKFSSQALEYP